MEAGLGFRFRRASAAVVVVGHSAVAGFARTYFGARFEVPDPKP